METCDTTRRAYDAACVGAYMVGLDAKHFTKPAGLALFVGKLTEGIYESRA